MQIIFENVIKKVNQKEFKKLVREGQEFFIRTFEDSYIKNYIIFFNDSQEEEVIEIQSLLESKGISYDIVDKSIWVSFDNYILESRLNFVREKVEELGLMDNIFLNADWIKYPVELVVLKYNNAKKFNYFELNTDYSKGDKSDMWMTKDFFISLLESENAVYDEKTDSYIIPDSEEVFPTRIILKQDKRGEYFIKRLDGSYFLDSEGNKTRKITVQEFYYYHINKELRKLTKKEFINATQSMMEYFNFYHEVKGEKYLKVQQALSKSEISSVHGLFETMVLALHMQAHSEKLGFKTFGLTKHFIEGYLGIHRTTAFSILIALTGSGLLERTKEIKINDHRSYSYKVADHVFTNPEDAFKRAYYRLQKIQKTAKTKGVSKILAKHVYITFGVEKGEKLLQMSYDFYEEHYVGKTFLDVNTNRLNSSIKNRKRREISFTKNLLMFMNMVHNQPYFDSVVRNFRKDHTNFGDPTMEFVSASPGGA